MLESDWTQSPGYQTLAGMLFSIKLSSRFNVEEKACLLGQTALQVVRWDRPEHEVDVVLFGLDVWDEFRKKVQNAGRLPHGRGKVVKAGEPAPGTGRMFSTMRLPNAKTVSVDRLLEGMLFGRTARVD